MMNRRTFLAGTGAVLLAAPLVGEAQQAGKTYRIGVLSSGSRSGEADVDGAFRETLKQLGYAEGRNLALEYRFAEGAADRLQHFAAELVSLKADTLVTYGTPASLAAKQITKSIPIVTVSTADPVGSGLVNSLGRPGGNVTGVSAGFAEIVGKWVELLRDVVPGISRIGFLGNADNRANKNTFMQIQAAAAPLRLAVEYFSATKSDEVGGALAAMIKARVQGVIVPGDAVIRSHRQEIADFAARNRLPAAYFGRDYVDVGGLMSYGPNRREIGRQVAVYVDKILKGARPSGLPVEEPTKYELVINLKTAKTMGLKIPQSLLLRADELIQ